MRKHSDCPVEDLREHPSYLMEDPREAIRLADKVDANAWVARFFSPHLDGRERILDVGCGPGSIAVAVARAHPFAQVTGIDSSADRIAALSGILPGNVRLETGDAQSLPFAAGSFDFVYSRFLLEYMANKQGTVAEMVRVCRPGGRVLLQDLDGQLVWHYPEDVELREGIGIVLAALAGSGFDPFVGRKLFALAVRAGLTDLSVSVESYHLFAGSADARNMRLWETKLDIAAPAAAKALGSDLAAKALKKRFLDYLERDDTLTYSVLFSVTGRTGGEPT